MKKLAALGLVVLFVAATPLDARSGRKRGPAVAVDPAVAEIVAPLGEKRDSESYEERESAMRALKAVTPGVSVA